MAKGKFYAVKKGKIPGIYCNWEEAKKQIKGFSGAIYKSFPTLEQAEEYMAKDINELKLNIDKIEKDINSKLEKKIKNIGDKEVIAFVNGSYSSNIDGKEKYGFGALLFTKKHKERLFKAFVNKEYMASKNIAGELIGVMQSISWAIKNNKDKITIYYDYEGVEKWAKKEWEAKQKITRKYRKFIDEKSKLIDINFVYTKADSGIRYKEIADSLAKRSLESQGYRTYDDGSVYFIGFSLEDWLSLIKKLVLENKKYNNEVKKDIINAKEYLNIVKLSSGKDSLVINCYRGNKSYVQGKESKLFQKLISFAIEELSTEKSVIETLNTYHALSITEEEVEKQLKILMPDFPSNIKDKKHYNNILSAVFNTMLLGYMPDYTCLITPIFRAMDYYLHRVLGDKLGRNTLDHKGRNKFGYFDYNKELNKYIYNSSTKGATTYQVEFLNDLYNYYNEIRHPYSHWSKDSIDTPVITDITVAKDLIIEGLKLINKYYILF